MKIDPRKWFKKPTNDEKVQALTERRDFLLSKAEWALDGVPALEERDAALVEQGKATKQKTTQLRLAAEINQVRKTAERQRVQARAFQQRADILSTDIQNLTLIETGNAMSDLGLDSESLTENAVAAEELLEQLTDQHGIADTVALDCPVSNEEQAIMAEFEETDEEEQEEKRSQELAEHQFVEQGTMDRLRDELRDIKNQTIDEESPYISGTKITKKHPPLRHPDGPPTDRQVQFLLKRKQAICSNMTKQEASNRIGEIKDREEQQKAEDARQNRNEDARARQVPEMPF